MLQSFSEALPSESRHATTLIFDTFCHLDVILAIV
jgi:hypothetical protein